MSKYTNKQNSFFCAIYAAVSRTDQVAEDGTFTFTLAELDYDGTDSVPRRLAKTGECGLARKGAGKWAVNFDAVKAVASPDAAPEGKVVGTKEEARALALEALSKPADDGKVVEVDFNAGNGKVELAAEAAEAAADAAAEVARSWTTLGDLYQGLLEAEQLTVAEVGEQFGTWTASTRQKLKKLVAVGILEQVPEAKPAAYRLTANYEAVAETDGSRFSAATEWSRRASAGPRATASNATRMKDLLDRFETALAKLEQMVGTAPATEAKEG